MLNKSSVFLGDSQRGRPQTEVKLPSSTDAGFRGLAWTPDGSRLFASTEKGFVQEFRLEGGKLTLGSKILLQPSEAKGNPVPGGLAITRDGSTDVRRRRQPQRRASRSIWRRTPSIESYPVQNLPFEPRLSEDEQTLVVSNWGGHLAESRRDRPPRATSSISWSTSGTPRPPGPSA